MAFGVQRLTGLPVTLAVGLNLLISMAIVHLLARLGVVCLRALFYRGTQRICSQRNLAGWQNNRCSDELAGNFVSAEGFVFELMMMMFSSISSIAWWGNL